jgi:diaminohydroxyphosphoribosylaminopyrimidine deaminase/5-amino-6-(5-phosphoribosylamino)uracil reductase
VPTDSHYMLRAIELASGGFYTVRSNPRVGCVIVNHNKVVGEGWHQFAGGPHAEIIALQQAQELAKGSTCYVTLEPCSHQGKTPPCVLALIQAEVKHVVIATLDPNPLVNGKGVRALRAAGITVEIGVCADEAYVLNKGFFKRMEALRPYIRVKLGMSIDGRTALANGKSHWITGDLSRQDVQYWRARACAILTSSQTVLDDNPQMNVRDSAVIAKIEAQTGLAVIQPQRLVLDAYLRTLPTQQIYQIPEIVTVFTRLDTPIPAAWANSGIKIVPIPVVNERMDFSAIMTWLGEQELNEILVEAGARLAGALCTAGLVDEWLIYMAPKFLGPQASPLLQLPELHDLRQVTEMKLIDSRQFGDDLRITYIS